MFKSYHFKSIVKAIPLTVVPFVMVVTAGLIIVDYPSVSVVLYILSGLLSFMTILYFIESKERSKKK